MKKILWILLGIGISVFLFVGGYYINKWYNKKLMTAYILGYKSCIENVYPLEDNTSINDTITYTWVNNER